jgi:hypothetical protein
MKSLSEQERGDLLAFDRYHGLYNLSWSAEQRLQGVGWIKWTILYGTTQGYAMTDAGRRALALAKLLSAARAAR